MCKGVAWGSYMKVAPQLTSCTIVPSCCVVCSLFFCLLSVLYTLLYAGKFKSSEGSFKADLLPISPQELLALLQESECQEAVKGMQNSGISDDDLNKLLDRSDLMAKWTSRLNGNNPGYYIRLLGMNNHSRQIAYQLG